MLPERVTLVEVGPRDGLQNEPQPIAAADKIGLIERLVAAGVRRIEAASFVSPKWVPQMAGSAEVMAGVPRRDGLVYSALAPNARGLEAACAAGVDEVVVFAAASEAFSQRNLNCSIEASIERFAEVAAGARQAGLRVRGIVSCALGCPFQGEVSPAEVERVVVALKAIGAQHMGVADTIGVGTPRRVQAVMEHTLRHFPLHEVSGHFHDTYGQALANILACLQMGVAVFDTSVAGLGGCPYAPGATGNVATEDVVYLLDGMGIETGIDLQALAAAGDWISARLGRPSASRVARALASRRAADAGAPRA